jgi:GAF domain-containing protein
MATAEQLTQRFADLARALHASATPTETQRLVTRAAVDLVPGCEHASISLVTRHGAVASVAATDQAAATVDKLQHDAGQGPCLDAIKADIWCGIPDLASDETERAFSCRASARTGIRSALSFRLFVEDRTLGALNMYSCVPAAFEQHAVTMGGILATHAAIAIAGARTREQCAELEEALITNREIAMAVGITMARLRTTPDQALDRLRLASRRSNRKMSDIAAEVVLTGQATIEAGSRSGRS